jgi:hypothetical protein
MAEVHPFRAAWQTRDLHTWGQTFAPDIVLHSPVLTSPFRGRTAGIELYEVLFDVIGDFEIVDEFSSGDTHAFFWRSKIGTRSIEGTDLVRHDEHGLIKEIRVFIRPLPDIATFAAAMGPAFAAKQGGASRGLLARVLTMPLRGLLVIADTLATRLVQSRSAP